jgi:hypothetical protein
VLVPLRLGGGNAIVLTRLGTEGIEAVSGRDILIAGESAALPNA